MSSQDQGKTGGGGGHPSPTEPPSTKKPDMGIVMSELMAFARKNPESKFTMEEFADALRQVAKRKQKAELTKAVIGVTGDIASPRLHSNSNTNMEPKTPSSDTHERATENTSGSSSSAAAQSSSAITPVPSTKVGQADLGTHQGGQASPAITITGTDGQELDPLNEEKHASRVNETSNAGEFAMATKQASARSTVNSDEATRLVESVKTASSDPGVAPACEADQSVLSIRPRIDGSEPADSTSNLVSTLSLDPNRILAPGPGFAASSSVTGNRKAPPPALNLEQPSRPEPGLPAPNHYVSVLAKSAKAMTLSPEKIKLLEAALNWNKSTAEPIVLLKSPVATSFSGDKKKEGIPSISDYTVNPIPKVDQGTTTNVAPDFTLETPLTATFAKEQVELKKEEPPKSEGAESLYKPDVKALVENQTGGSDANDNKEEGEGKKDRDLQGRSSQGISRFHRIHLALQTGRSRVSRRIDLIAQLSLQVELIVEVAKHLPPSDLLNLYSIHRPFHEKINLFLRSSTLAWTNYNCPEAALVYNWHSAAYRHLTIPDPAGRPLVSPLTPYGFHPWRPVKNQYQPKSVADDKAYLESKGIDTSSRKGKEKAAPWDGRTAKCDHDCDNHDHDHAKGKEDNDDVHRLVPSLKWYAMCYTRQETVDDILAHLARRGHRTPPRTSISLLKMWKLMATPTNAERREIIRCSARSKIGNCKCWILEAKQRMDDGKAVPCLKVLERMVNIGMENLPEGVQGFTDLDLLRIQCFFLKLDLRCNDPLYGPEDTDLSELMLGQRSLVPLRQLLYGERYHKIDQLLALKVRYDLGATWSVLQPAAPAVLSRQNFKLVGVPFDDWGKEHLEYWGERACGSLVEEPRASSTPYDINRTPMVHVQQIVAEEAVRRKLNLDAHLLPLLLWGCVDWKTGRNLHPTESEIYIRDAAHKTRHMDTSEEYTRIEILKARWPRLTTAEQEEVLAAQLKRDDLLRKWDNNQIWDRQDHDDHDDQTVQLSYAVMQPITGRTGPPSDPTLTTDTGAPLDNDDDSVETPGHVTALLLELENMADSDFGDQSDTDSDIEEENGSDDNENAWKPKTRRSEDVQLPQSFIQKAGDHAEKLHRAALASASSRSSEQTPYWPYSGLPPSWTAPTPNLNNGNNVDEEGHPIVDHDFINNVLQDLDQELSDGDLENAVNDEWDDFEWTFAPKILWSFLNRKDNPEAQPAAGSSTTTTNNPPITTETMEETVEAAWAALQEAEKAARAAGFRNIQARPQEQPA
ncbi:hypothetical protein PG996_015099 [Apiospora saccharicola]|uniref:Uncharacterized protein n=1 Tax=Apiospora saccharicola TaxID=335842 RepID=A0ABR1TK56_9PEZI